MKTIKLTIPYEPTAKGVARVKFIQGRIITYYHWKTTEALEAIRAIITDMHLEPFPEHTPIRIDVTFWRTRPKWSLKREKLPVRKPDLDNFCKTILDAVSPLIVPDDAQITSLIAFKKWSENGRGYIDIELTEDKP